MKIGINDEADEIINESDPVINNESMSVYKQAEFQGILEHRRNGSKKYCYRGKILNIEIIENVIQVEFEYICEKVKAGYKPCVIRHLSISISLARYIGVLQPRTICIMSESGMAVFFSPNSNHRILANGNIEYNEGENVQQC